MERYVKFETAQLLKQRGFREPCRRCYDCKGEVAIEYMRPSLPFMYADKDIYLCPTQAEVTDWLRETHLIFIEVSVSITLDEYYRYSYLIMGEKCKLKKRSKYDEFKSFADATEDAIIKALKLDIWKEK